MQQINKDQFIISLMTKISEITNIQETIKIKYILETEFYNYDIFPVCTALVPINNSMEKLLFYLATKKIEGLSEATLKNYKRILYIFLQHIQKDVENITTMDIRMYINHYSKGGQKNTTISTLISTLKSFFSWLYIEKYIPDDPCLKVKNIKCEKKLVKALSQEEMEVLRDKCCNTRSRAILEASYSFGSRISELLALNKSDIKWESSSVILYGKGKKEREVYLNAKAKVHLWKYLESRTDTNEALFVSEREPHERIGTRAVQKVVRQLGRDSGITQRVFPHRIRHCVASDLLRRGMGLDKVKDYLGHDDSKTTLRYCDINQVDIKMEHMKYSN